MGQHTQTRYAHDNSISRRSDQQQYDSIGQQIEQTSEPSFNPNLLRLIVKQWVNQSSGSCHLCEAFRTANLHGVSLCEPYTQLRVLQETGSSALPACQRLVSATLTAYSRSPPYTRRLSNRLPSGPTQAMQRRKNQKPTLLIATQKGHIHLVAAQTAEQQIPSPSRKKPSTASIRKPNVSLENHPNLEWDWSCGSPSWLLSAPYSIPGSWTARSETPKATRSQPWIPLPTLVAWYHSKARRVSTSMQGHRRLKRKEAKSTTRRTKKGKRKTEREE